MDNKADSSLGLKLRYLFVWLDARENVPKGLIAGGYSAIKLARFSMTLFALLLFSSVALGSPVWNSASLLSLWYGLISAAYVIFAIIFLLGLRMWYGSGVLFFLLSGLINLHFGNGASLNPLGAMGTLGISDAISLSWFYLVLVGILLMRYDRGSRVNDLLVQS